MTAPLHAATPSRTVCHGFASLAMSVSDDRDHRLAILRPVDAPRLERGDVGCGGAGRGDRGAQNVSHESVVATNATAVRVCVHADRNRTESRVTSGGC